MVPTKTFEKLPIEITLQITDMILLTTFDLKPKNQIKNLPKLLQSNKNKTFGI